MNIVGKMSNTKYFCSSLYLLFPRSAPLADSEHLKEIQKLLPDMIEAGEARSMGSQALMQFVAIAVTLGIAIVSGVITGDHKLALIAIYCSFYVTIVTGVIIGSHS